MPKRLVLLMKAREDPPVASAIGLKVDLHDLERRLGLSLHARHPTYDSFRISHSRTGEMSPIRFGLKLPPTGSTSKART